MKGYIPRITASRHLIGKDSLVISFAVSINLGQRRRRRKKKKYHSFQSFQLEQLTGLKGSSHALRARHLQLLSQQVLVNLILLFSNLPELCWLLENRENKNKTKQMFGIPVPSSL